MEENKELIPKQAFDMVPAYDEAIAYGFEETKADDIVIPRIKVIQALSPERVDGIAVEGDLLNSLTQEKVNGLRFVPIKQYYTNIRWNPDRNAELRMLCRSFDGRVGQDYEVGSLVCAVCKKNQFDNSKTGKDAQPTCTAFLNFLGFFEGNPMPVVLSFARTNYNEGKKMLSIAKSMRTAAWNYAYTMESKKVSKDKNTWYIMIPRMAGETTKDVRILAFELFKAYERTAIKADYEDAAGYDSTTEVDDQTAKEI